MDRHSLSSLREMKETEWEQLEWEAWIGQSYYITECFRKKERVCVEWNVIVDSQRVANTGDKPKPHTQLILLTKWSKAQQWQSALELCQESWVLFQMGLASLLRELFLLRAIFFSSSSSSHCSLLGFERLVHRHGRIKAKITNGDSNSCWNGSLECDLMFPPPLTYAF